MTSETIIFPPCANSKVPQPTVDFHHAVDAQLRFNDIDMFGHVNNSVYMQLLDLGKIRYFEALLGHAPDPRELAVVIVNINASFFSPAYFEEPLKIATTTQSVSTHSFILEQRIYNSSTGDVKCVATTVMAAFDPATRTGSELPVRWTDAIADFEHRR